MKGLDTIKAFLESGEPLSKDSLPSRGPGEVDREALIHTIMSFHKALRASNIDTNAVQELVSKKANATTTSASPDGETAPKLGAPTAPAGAEKKDTVAGGYSSQILPQLQKFIVIIRWTF